MKHYIGECRIYEERQVESLRWWCFLQGALAGAGLTVLVLYGPRLWDAWTAWAAADWLR